MGIVDRVRLGGDVLTVRRLIIALEFAGACVFWAAFWGPVLLTDHFFFPALFVLLPALIAVATLLWSTLPVSVIAVSCVLLSLFGHNADAGNVLMIFFFSFVVATEVVLRVPVLARSRFITCALTAPLVIIAVVQVPFLVSDVKHNLEINGIGRPSTTRSALVLPALRYTTGEPVPLTSSPDVFVLYFWTEHCEPCQRGLARLGPFAASVPPLDRVHVVAVPVEPGLAVPEWLPTSVERTRSASEWFKRTSDGAVPWTLFVSGGRICGSTVGYSPRMEARWASMIRSCRGNS